MTAQSVILPLPSDHARFIVLRLKDLTIAELKNNSKLYSKHVTVSLLNIQTHKLKQQSLWSRTLEAALQPISCWF